MRNKTTKIALALGMLLLASQAQADQLADIKAAGVVKVATFDANPPFGSVDAKTHHIVGYDVDFAQALAKALGVKLELVATNPANRIPLLQSGKADLIVADITITPERAQVIDFSTPYFVTGQQFLVPAGSPDKLDEYSKARIGAYFSFPVLELVAHHFRAPHRLPHEIYLHLANLVYGFKPQLGVGKDHAGDRAHWRSHCKRDLDIIAVAYVYAVYEAQIHYACVQLRIGAAIQSLYHVTAF